MKPSTRYGFVGVGIRHLVVLVFATLCGCARSNAPAPTASMPAGEPAPQTSTNVLAEPLPGKRVRISITAKDESLCIVNCNEHIVVSLRAVGAPHIAWGGASDACLSPSIIVPARATLSFVVAPDNGSSELDTSLRYTALVGGVRQAADIRSPPVPLDRMTSNAFKLIP